MSERVIKEAMGVDPEVQLKRDMFEYYMIQADEGIITKEEAFAECEAAFEDLEN